MQPEIQVNDNDVEILIVEDSTTQRLQLQHVLERHGYRVTVADSGEHALVALQASKPTLVISDINMPGMDGYQLCQKIKATPSLRDVPVILLTTLSAPKDIIRGLECGADNFIVKPYDEHFLVSRIHFILANQELRKTAGAEMGITVYFGGQKYFITSDRLQILNLLLTTYETAVQRNQELNEAREALEVQKQELARSNAELQQFAYVASHDLQEPLRMITSYLDLLEGRYKGKLDESADDFIHFAVDGARRMSRLINDLLTYARVDTHGKPLVPTDGDRALEAALANLQIAIAEAHAAVTHDPMPTVKADEGQLVQLFQNLIGNGIKFHKKTEPPHVHVAAGRSGNEWTFSVRDNGIGIVAAQIPRMFQIFQRLHTRDEYPGTGIGLAVCKKIVERHGGRIWLESEAGRGTTFFFSLPACEEPT
ncbi:MAG: response regulator [Verrucomicrobia bacterium]|nr:response regulator [Verrucomicrobiota bacterium]